MNKDLIAIFEYLEREKGIKRDVIISALEEALLTAARKSVKGLLNIRVKINSKTGDIEVHGQKEVVDNVTIPEEEITLADAKLLNEHVQIGDWVDIACMPQEFGRIAAQAAKQVISQKLRSAERDVIYEEYRHRVDDLISGTVKRIGQDGTLIIDLGKVEGLMPYRFYPKTEKYKVGDRVQALLFEVHDTDNGGAQIILSRSHPEFVRQLFLQEVPELEDGTITIEKIVRDPGYRTKIAVKSSEIKIDPVGTCVGVRGNRVKSIIGELNNEKIDIIPFTEDPIQLLINAVFPIELKKILVNEDEESVTIVVEDENYPAVLGKRGMNARLNSQLIGYDLQIQKMSDYLEAATIQRQQLAASTDPTLDQKLHIEGMNSLIIESLISAGYDTPRKVLVVSPKELSQVPGISLEMATKILEEICKQKGLKVG